MLAAKIPTKFHRTVTKVINTVIKGRCTLKMQKEIEMKVNTTSVHRNKILWMESSRVPSWQQDKKRSVPRVLSIAIQKQKKNWILQEEKCARSHLYLRFSKANVMQAFSHYYSNYVHSSRTLFLQSADRSSSTLSAASWSVLKIEALRIISW